MYRYLKKRAETKCKIVTKIMQIKLITNEKLRKQKQKNDHKKCEGSQMTRFLAQKKEEE